MRKIIRYILVLPFAVAIAYWLAGKFGDTIEEPLRNVLFAAKGDSIPDYAPVFYDDKGIPYVVYATENGITPGKQYNATIVANFALEQAALYDSLKQPANKQAFDNCINWLKVNATVSNDTALYRYAWRQAWYPKVPAPFTSGMTNGMVMQAMLKAHAMNADTAAWQLARQLLHGCFVSIDSGGFTIMEPQGWWYEEFAAVGVETPRILDGHIFTVIGLLQYRNQQQEPLAAIAAEMGLQSLKYYLPAYDAGQQMYYDKYKKLADRKYKQVITTQLLQLYQLTNEAVFLQYYEKWTTPLKVHYVKRVLAERNKTGALLLGLLLIVCWLPLYIGLKLLIRKTMKPRRKRY